MKIGELLLLLTFFGLGASLIGYSLNDYLIARTVGPATAEPLTIKSGQPLKIDLGNPPPSGQIAITICNEAPSGPNCLPLAVASSASSVTIRIPIGYQSGPAKLETAVMAKPVNRGLFTIQLNIQ